MSNSVGRAELDLGINYKGFQREMGSISSKANNMLGGSFKKLGGIIAGAFAVKSLINFSKSAIQIASDLEEVQNVVDVTFGNLSNEVNTFAKNAMTSFGLSELSAKKFASTMGAMLKSSGLTGQKVADMSIEMTKLSADIASFYNLKPEEAFNKIRAGISGETEPLKQLGINLNVANLEAYALSQGITKSYNSMSQAEQVLLRYNYLLNTAKDAQGDFARTSGSWANQITMLSEQWSKFKATIGAGLINIFAGAIKVINAFILKLQIAAEYFRAFTQMLFGNAGASSGGSGIAQTAEALSGMGDAAEAAGGAATDATDATAKGAKKANKELNKTLAGFDELNLLADKSADSSGGSGGSGGVGDVGGLGGLDLSGADQGENVFDKADISANKFKETLKGLVDFTGLDVFWEKIKRGYNSINFDNIRANFSSIMNSLKPIAETAFLGLGYIISGITSTWGSIIGGSLLSAGIFVETLSLAFAKFFEENTIGIQEWIAGISLSIGNGYNNIASIVDGIFSYFNTSFLNNKETLATSMADMLTGITTFYSSISTIVANMFEISTQSILDFVTTNKPLFDNFFNGLFELWTQLNNLVGQVFGDIGKSMSTFWEGQGKSIFKGISDAIMDIIGMGMRLWNEFVQPFISFLVKELAYLWDSTLKPLWDKILDFIGSFSENILAIWNEVLKPWVDWFIKNMMPIILDVLKGIIQGFTNVLKVVIDIIGGVLGILKGLITFLTGIFTGDWDRVWKGIQQMFSGVWDIIASVFKGVINGIINGLNVLIRGLNKLKIDVPDWVPGLGGKEFKLNVPEIPRLANGGLVSAPTLAMVGDNKNARNDPEVISPLSKLQDMLSGSNEESVEILKTILEIIRSWDPTFVLKLNDTEFARAVISAIKNSNRSLGTSII